MITPAELAILRKPEVQEYIREFQGDPKGYDQFHCLTCGAYFQQKDGDCHCNDYDSEKWIVIPDCISRDSDRPERGVAGMIDGEFILQRWIDGWSVTISKPEMKMFEADTPRLAFLKALLFQIEANRGK